MRQYIIAGNWKMNKTVSESIQLAKDIVEAVKDVKKTEVVIAPTYLAAAKVADIIKGTNVKLAIQDIHWKDQGAFTGKVSVDMVKEIGAEYIIIGHSEQRQYFHETDETVNLKVKKTLEAGRREERHGKGLLPRQQRRIQRRARRTFRPREDYLHGKPLLLAR